MATLSRDLNTEPDEHASGGAVAAALRGLAAAVDQVDALDLTELPAAALLGALREVEVLRRRVDHAVGRFVDEVDRSGAHSTDGHRTTAAALRHLGRVSGAEAHVRVRTVRALRQLPEITAAYARGQVPCGSLHAISRTAANPRVRAHLARADAIIAELAATEDHDGFVAWLREWESLADADGAEPAAERTHRRRRASLTHNEADGSRSLRIDVGALQGVVLEEVLAWFERAELETDRADAVARLGDGATSADYARSATQRRADAIVAIFRRAAATPAGDRNLEPLVSIVVDQQTFDDALRRAAGQPVDDAAGPTDPRICRTAAGHPVSPSDALVAALVGQVRRVVLDAASNVIDLGRRRRLFTGASREAAIIQAAIGDPAGLRCLWSGCNSPPGYLQVDHQRSWREGGGTDVANSSPLCGHHNRLKEAGYRPVRAPDGGWVLYRPDGTPITPAA